MSSDAPMRTYRKTEVVFFRTTSGEYGPLSNMAPDFPVVVHGIRIPTVEALYQACRYPDFPDVQSLIIDQLSPMTAKMKSKKNYSKTRSDWESVRVNVMRWCLRLKLMQNWTRFGSVLEKTGTRPIVEESKKDAFWGAKPNDNDELVGTNALGRLLMELRAQYCDVQAGRIATVSYPTISHFVLLGIPIEEPQTRTEVSRAFQPTMFD